MTYVRTLPIRLAPLPGEALDSWLEALAHRLRCRYGSVLADLGLRNVDSAGVQGNTTDWTIALTDQEADDIAYAVGLEPQLVHGLTLASYDGRALLVDRGKREVNRRRLWGRGSGSRYCPGCLAESGGRWQLTWRLGWSFACIRHRTLLADTCPACGRVPRRRPFSLYSSPIPGHCAALPSRKLENPTAPAYEQDLGQAQMFRLPTEHPVLEAQRTLTDAIGTGVADFGQYARRPQPCATALAEIRAVASRMLAFLSPEDLAALVPRDVHHAYIEQLTASGPQYRKQERPGFMAPPTATMTAVAVLAALRALGESDLKDAARTLRPVTSVVREGSERTTATTAGTWGRGTGPVLRAIQLAALGPSMRPSDQLRYRTAVDPAPPSAAGQLVSRRARALPAMLWPHWTVRLSPADGAYPRILAPALAAAVLVVGSTADLDRAAAILGRATDGTSISRMLQKLEQDPNWKSIANALTRLADHLDESGAPIDYTRRRSLDYSALLPSERWSQICREADQAPGTGLRLRIARCVMFSQISGNPIELAPGFPTTQASRFRAQAERFTEVWAPQVAHGLQEAARDFIDRTRARGEPVSWHPPTTLLDGIELPGCDIADIDIDRLHQLARGRRSPARDAAAALSVSIEAVRLVLEEHPVPPSPLTPAQARARGKASQAAREALTEEDLRRRYVDERQSARTIAQDLGVSRQVITRLAAQYDIPMEHGRRSHPPVDQDWLIEQYVELRRTLPELAREVGVSTTLMNRWAHEFGIPLRPRGGASHREALHSGTGIPS